jgi:uncharacterized membrane protein
VTEGDDPFRPPARRDDEIAEEVEGEVVPDDAPPPGPFGLGYWAQFRSGPLPEAWEYESYETTLPGAADRILRLTERAMDLTEREATHRHSVEAQIVRGNLKNQNRGQLIAAAFGAVGFAAAITFVALGKNAAAFVAILVPLGAFISRFIRRPNGQ